MQPIRPPIELSDEEYRKRAYKELPINAVPHKGITLANIFEEQKEFRAFLIQYTKLGSMTRDERTAYYCLGLMTELGELLENVRGWKPHQTHPPTVDEQNVKEELTDIFHFLINLFIEWNISPEDALKNYWQKHMQNRYRQHTGY